MSELAEEVLVFYIVFGFVERSALTPQCFKICFEIRGKSWRVRMRSLTPSQTETRMTAARAYKKQDYNQERI